jgi:hypothetical protein
MLPANQSLHSGTPVKRLGLQLVPYQPVNSQRAHPFHRRVNAAAFGRGLQHAVVDIS